MKRPRTQPLDLSLSSLTAPPLPMVPPADVLMLHTLAKLDAGLGLSGTSACSTLSVGDSDTDSTTLRITKELDQLLSKPSHPLPPLATAAPWGDDVSCVSGSAPRGTRAHVGEECSVAMDVLEELRELDARSSATAISQHSIATAHPKRKRARHRR